MLHPLPPDIPRRRLDFHLSSVSIPAGFYANDPSLSLVLTALSLVFPEGERFFVDSVLHFRDRITDPVLAARVRGFTAQEAMHAKEHNALNTLLERQGLAGMAPLGRDVARLLARARQRRTPEQRLAVTCALEHITAILGADLLHDDGHRNAIHPTLRGLWVWHALEECEHKDVAFDVYQAVDGSYGRRVAMMATATFGLLVFVTRAHLRLLRERRLLGDLPALAHTIEHLWLRPGIFRRLIPAYLRYYRRDFHPSQLDTTALVAAWRERLFGNDGELRAALDVAAQKERRAA